MEPNLAESVPHRGRAIAFAAALTALAAVAALAVRAAPSHHHRRHLHRGTCTSSVYVYVTR